MAEHGVARSTSRFERKREAILDAATAILNRDGVKGLTLSLAAAAVGLSTTSVTYYFKRKDELAAACMLRGIGWLHEMAGQALAEPDPRAQLRRLFELYLEHARSVALGESPAMPQLADLRALNEPQLSEVFAAYMKLFRRVRQLFDGPGLPSLSRGRRTARTHMLMEQLFWAAAWLPHYAPQDYPAVGARMFEIFADGLAVDGALWSPAAVPMAELADREGLEPARETFLMAATRLINTRGYRGASVEKISAALNVTKGSFYHHIEAKDDLVVACFERTFEVIQRVQRLAQAQDGDAWATLSTGAAALAEFQLSEFGPLLRTSALAALPEPICVEMVCQSTRVYESYARIIADGAAQGALRPVDSFIAAQMLMAALNAGSELAFWVPGMTQKAAPAVFARPLLMGIFSA